MKLQITLSVKFSLNENRGKFVLSLNNKLKLNKTKKLKSESQNFYRLSLNPHVPDRFTPSRARCAENCGSAVTHR